MIGIIGAMEEEVSEILKYVNLNKTSEIQGYKFHEGTISGKDIVLMQSGIGKVNSTLSTTLLFTNYDVDYVINVGSAGGLNLSQNVGDIVISDAVAHHDVDVTAFGRAWGEVPGMPLFFKPDAYLCSKVKEIIEQNEYTCHTGLIVSGDQFICKSEQVETIQSHFKDAMCAEMEAASIAQVCHVFNKKFIILRSLSDIFNKGENSVQFDEYLKKASRASAKICKDLVSVL